MFNYFSDLNKGEHNDNVYDFNMDEILYEVNNPSTINKEIIGDKIMEAIKELKYHKAAGVHRVVNEYIKSTATLLMPVYVKLLNTIFYNEDLPNEWHTGIIIAIYKKLRKSATSRKLPTNHITLLLL